MRFNLFDHPIAAMSCDYFCPGIAWAGHAPFANLIVELLEPGTIVELGTHFGASYCAFCQAVAELKLPTRCFAVDTWKGDQHTGAYSSDVMDFLRNHHDPLYSSFSTLLQMTFDEAAGRFADGSIDLLHIDGAHDFDAVSHDYQTWRSKVSDRGVILFHVTYEKAAGFGVHRLWAELAGQFPSFEFHHNHGLGVLGVGKNLPPRFIEFLDEARANPQGVRELFAGLGRAYEADCILLLAGNWAHQARTEINRHKRLLGQTVEPQSEDLHHALDDPRSYIHKTLSQAAVMIRELSESQRGRAPDKP